MGDIFIFIVKADQIYGEEAERSSMCWSTSQWPELSQLKAKRVLTTAPIWMLFQLLWLLILVLKSALFLKTFNSSVYKSLKSKKKKIICKGGTGLFTAFKTAVSENHKPIR